MVDLLSVRENDVGGRVASRLNPPTFFPSGTRLVILVHGYNVSKANAKSSYEEFIDLLQKHRVSTNSIYGQIVGFCWPGDVNLGKFSGLFYPTKMGVVRESAGLLARFLTTLRGADGLPIQVFLVAHSLGNKLALQTIANLLQQPRGWGRVEALCLMAAAVPVGMIENLNRLGSAALASRTRVLFSKDDTVLHWAFPPGETAAFEGFFPQAVGRFGNPVTRWAERFDLQPYNHGDYFSGKGGDDRSARYVAQFLGAPVATELPRAQPYSHSLPAPNNIPGRAIGEQ